jgi:hypothetical protein
VPEIAEDGSGKSDSRGARGKKRFWFF